MLDHLLTSFLGAAFLDVLLLSTPRVRKSSDRKSICRFCNSSIACIALSALTTYD